MKRILTAACAVAFGFTLNAANYTWCGAGEPNADGSRNWEDSANWLLDGSKVVEAGYPGVAANGSASAGDQAWFTNKTNEEAVVKLSRALTIGYLYLHQATTPVTLKGGTTTNDVLVVNNDFNADTASYSVTLDHIAIRRVGNVTFGPNRALALKNGANFYVNGFAFKSGTSVTMSEGSWLRSSSFGSVGDDVGNTVTLSGGSTWLCVCGPTFPKKFALSLSEGSQFLAQADAGTSFYNLNAYGGVNTISLVGGSLLRCNELYIGYPGQVITLDDSTIDARGTCLVGNTLPGGGEINFKGAAPKFTVKGTACRVQNNNAGMNVPFVFRYFVPEGGYAEPPFQYLCNTTTECFGSWVNPTKLTQFVVDPSSPAKTAGTLTETALAYSTSGFYRSSAKPNYTDITDMTGGALRFTDGAGVTDTTAADGKKSKYVKATIGSGEPAHAPVIPKSMVGSVVPVVVNRKTFTATTVVLAKSTVAAKTVALLYASGEGIANEVVAQAEIPVAGAYDLVWTAPTEMFERNYQHWIVLVDYDADGNELSSSTSAPTTVMSKDTTTYTWTGRGAEGDWTDPANWSDNQEGDCLHFPGTSGATATFPAGTKLTFVVTTSVTCGWLNMNSANNELTFVPGEGVTTNDVRWTISSINLNANDTRLTFDGVAFAPGGISLGTRSKLTLKNGANVHTGDLWFDNYGVLDMSGDSWLSCNQIGLGGGDSVIDDSTLWTRSHDCLGRKYVGGSITFRGTHPIWWHNNKDGYFYSNLANAGYQLNFAVPVGGYAVAPIRAISNQAYLFGNNGNSAGSSVLKINILDESPANRVDETIETTLVSWPKGINKAMVAEGDLPDDGTGTDDAFVWSAEANPLTLGVRIVGSTHANALATTGYPERIASTDISPAYGFTDVAEGDTVTCQAPAAYVQVSEKKRAIVTGWKLYAVDAATHVRTQVDHGTGNSCTYTNTDGLWHELEWQWQVEYLVSVASAGNGSASVDQNWIPTGSKVRFTVTPDAGFGFFKWTGDVAANRDKTADLFITVRDRPYALTANFLPTVSVSSEAGELADVVAANAGKIILLPDALYPVTKQVVVGANTIIRGARTKGDEPVVKCMTRLSENTTAPSSVFKLTHADAALDGIAITTASPNANTIAANNYDYARGVWLDGAGLVDHCVITNCRSLYCSSEGGGGVFLNGGGVVRNTKIIDCRTYASGGNNAKGHAAFIKLDGLLETCEIRQCGVDRKNAVVTSSSASVLITGGTVRNCLIVDNTQGHSNGDEQRGVGITVNAQKPCVVDNCTIAGNYMMASTTTVGLNLFNSNSSTATATFRNNIIWNNRNSMGVQNWWVRGGYPYTAQCNCTTPALAGLDEIDEDPTFTDASNGDYTINYSPSVDSAVYLDWMDDVTDLAGNPRCTGVAPDRGCYEFSPEGLVCGITVAQEGDLDDGRVTLTASVLGDTEGLVYTWTLTDQDGTETVRSGADLGTLVLDVGVGRYSVALSIRNGAGETGSAEKLNCAEVCPSEIYVATDGSATYPYASFATGATSLLDAIAAATDGSTIHVADGFYVEEDSLKLVKDVRLVSEHGPGAVKIHAMSQTTGNPMVLLAARGAVLSGVTLSGIGTDGKQRQQWSGLQILAAGGTVTNCWIRDNKTVSISVHGAGARLEGGTVVDCVFSNNWTQCSGGGGMKGGAVYMTGANAVVDRCLMIGNKIATGGVSYGGGVYLNAGLVRNCLLDGNFSQNYGGGAAVEGSGVLQNCTVVRNSSVAGNGGIWQNGTGRVVDCLSWNNTVNGAAEDVDDPGFVDAPNGDFHLTSASAAVDAGTAANPGELDLDQMPRVSGRTADAGCFEYDQSQFSVGIAYEKLAPFAPGAVRFTAVVTPETATLDAEQTWWTFDGTEPSAENHDAVGLAVERTCAPGYVSVRFKTVHEGETIAIDRADWFAYYGEKVYVLKGAENPVFPYSTPETATPDYAIGMEALQENATLVMGEGTWTVAKTYTLGKPCMVVGAGPGKTVIDQNIPGNGMTSQAFVISNPEATVSGITFMNARSWNPGGAIDMSAGTVTNCSFVNSTGLNAAQGGALRMTGGRVLDSSFVGCGSRYYNSPDNVSKGCVIAASGDALIDRCVITGACNLPGSKEGQTNIGDGAVSLASAWVNGAQCGPTMRNTIVTGSMLGHCGGVVTYDRAHIENCTIVDNASTNTAGKVGGLRHDGSVLSTVVNTIVYGNTSLGQPSEVSGNAAEYVSCLIGVDPKFRATGRRCTPSLAQESPAIDAGTTLEWMTEGARDFYRRNRVEGAAPDIGAVEASMSGLRLLVR